MINSNDGTITVLNKDNEFVKIQIIFSFEIPEFKKRYIAYTYEANKESDEIDVLISEMDWDTYEIKNIPKNEIDLVLEYYNNAKLLLEN